jgi:uncharacterized protein
MLRLFRFGTIMGFGVTDISSGVVSPCLRVCVVNPRHKLCVGCGRSLDEIAGWMSFSDGERAWIMAALPARLAALRSAGEPRPAA